MQILAISGSLRAQSSNTNVLLAAQRLAPPHCTIAIYDGLANLPHFNPDLDSDHPPETVSALRKAIGSCQGLLLCSPEYAGGVSGSLKNALDWLVSGPEFYQKPVMLINASQRATSADAHLRLTLKTMAARLVEPSSITLAVQGKNFDADGIVADEVFSQQLRNALATFIATIAAYN